MTEHKVRSFLVRMNEERDLSMPLNENYLELWEAEDFVVCSMGDDELAEMANDGNLEVAA